MPESSDEPIRRETFRKPVRQECADWEAQLNQAILATDIREGWEGFVDLFDRFYDEEVMVVTGYEGAGVSGQGANRERLLQVLVPLHVVTELGVVQIERFELKESVVAESGETRSTWLLETASSEMGSRSWRWTARREWREGRVISETLATVENRVRGAEDSSDPFTGERPAPMSGTEIRQLGPRDASEYQAIFLEALRSAPEAFAADYEQESARSLEEVVERFQREGIYGGFASGRLQAIATFQRQTMTKRRHVGMVWNMYVAEGQRGTGLAAALFHHVLEVASREVDQVDLYVAVENERAWRFYQRFGFESYGVMPRALRVAGADYDALMMTRKFR